MNTTFLKFWIYTSVCLALSVCAGESWAEKIAVGLLLDQPAGKVLELEPGFVAEVAERLEKVPGTDSLTFTPIFPNAEGKIVGNDGTEIDLNTFQKLWIHQGDEVREGTALFHPAVMERVKAYLNADVPHVVLMTGGASTLMKALEMAEVTSKVRTIMHDRVQVGLVPVDPGAFLWKNLVEDRGVFWFTNATFPPYDSYQLNSPNTVILARNPGGPNNPVTLTRCGKSVVISLPWCFSLLYDHAAATFRTNTETFLHNIMSWHVNDADLVALSNPPTPGPKPLPTAALRRAVEYLHAEYGTAYPGAADYLRRLEEFESGQNTDLAAFETLRRDALLANPQLDFENILYIERKGSNLGMPQNYNSNSVLGKTGYANTIREMNLRTGESRTIFTPPNDFFVGDLELHFDADRLLFSMPSPTLDGNRWRLWEIRLSEASEGKPAARLVPTIEEEDVDNYDACYLPDDGLVFCSTACFTGVPCINGSGHVCNLYRKEGENGKVYQMTMEQDHDWCPTLLPNGRVMYLRWEYSDLPHAFSRILFHCNPDGTNQSEYYGSGSYYPASMFFARPLPGTRNQFVAICGGHHELSRIGDMVIFDPSKGRKEAEGAVQRIPGFGKPVEPVTLDFPIAQTWPKFLHPFPISDKFFLVACQTEPGAGWRVCLVDVFDNILPLVSAEGMACLEPLALRKTERPPVLMNRTENARTDADVFIADIYYGQGLKGVPRGTVKALRIFSYEFSYQGMGGEPYSLGLDGPWDPKRVLGTVPVYEDGSASFKIPAYTPVAFQPLDADGRAIQLMRSWTIAMPGESVSCSGCHEEQNSVPPPIRTPMASKTPAVDITPFYGPTRGFSFRKEVQPVLDRHCVACHEEKGAISFKWGAPVPAFKNPGGYNQASRFSPSYYNLRRYVRTQTKESQMGVHKPYEFHADSTFLVQLLKRGHYGVTLDRESWDRLYTWIDLNCPHYGSWGESRNHQIAPLVKHQYERRLALRQLYTNQSAAGAEDPDGYPSTPDSGTPVYPHTDFIIERSAPTVPSPTTQPVPENVPLSENVSLNIVQIPGTNLKFAQCEITNEQYRLFDPSHDTGIEYGDYIQFSPGESGWLLSRANQPVSRISYDEAVAFCEWLSAKTGRKFRLPTLEEWTRAAQAGTSTPFWFGQKDVDYADFENLSDISNQKINPFSWLGRVDALPPWRIADTNVNDRARVSTMVGSYRPNPYGLYDIHGNVSEWTSTSDATGKRVVAGGSWYTPARWSTVDVTRSFDSFQKVFDVGFRVICE